MHGTSSGTRTSGGRLNLGLQAFNDHARARTRTLSSSSTLPLLSSVILSSLSFVRAADRPDHRQRGTRRIRRAQRKGEDGGEGGRKGEKKEKRGDTRGRRVSERLAGLQGR